MTLRARLLLGYAVAMALALALFGGVALALVDASQRSAADDRLRAIVHAAGTTGDDKNGRLRFDADDRRQFLAIVGASAQSAVTDRSGDVLVATNRVAAETVVAARRRLDSPRVAASYSVRIGRQNVHVYEEPITARAGTTALGFAYAWADDDAREALDRRVAAGFAVAIPILAALSLVGGGAVARRGLAPLDAIASLAARIEGHDLSRRLALGDRPDELGRLAATFDRMLDRLSAAFERERRFTSDASHELRAPLSVIRAEADLALRGERSAAEYRRALEVIVAEAESLERLTRDLLVAARGGAGDAGVAAIDLVRVAAEAGERVASLAREKRVAIGSPAAAVVLVRANAALLERAVLAALHNAIKAVPDGGRVELAVGRTAAGAVLTVVDDGPGFSPDALERAFDRFWRDDDSRASEGSGLGLSIARVIVERFDGSIALSNVVPHGACVSIVLPVTGDEAREPD